MNHVLPLAAALAVALVAQDAHAQDGMDDGLYGTSMMETADDDADAFMDEVGIGEDTAAPDDAALEDYDTDGKVIYLLCITGPRDSGDTVDKKCGDVKIKLRRDYPRHRIVRLDNPTEERMERIKEYKQDDIAIVIIVTHSTPGPTDEDWDVWDTELDPIDFAECFYDEFIIWNGCYSRALCHQADNILPVQCDEDFLPVADDTWREIAECLFETEGPVTRDEVCREVFGEDWSDGAEE